jgi:hypothetical protein
LLDGAPLPSSCESAPIAGDDKRIPSLGQWVAHRCQLSFPVVTSGQSSRVLPGRQDDGVHTLVSTNELGLVVFGFDRFVSYAYVGGLNAQILN